MHPKRDPHADTTMTERPTSRYLYCDETAGCYRPASPGSLPVVFTTTSRAHGHGCMTHRRATPQPKSGSVEERTGPLGSSGMTSLDISPSTE